MLSLFIYDGVVPLNWVQKIQENNFLSLFYRISPLFYSISGILVLMLHKIMQKYDDTFWWITFGVMLIIQGLCSYMSDVEYWGQNSYWEIIDTFIATILTLVAGPLVIFRAFNGYATYPFYFNIIWICCATFSLYCKYMSNQCIQVLNAEHYLFWHALWHCMPLYASFLILLL